MIANLMIHLHDLCPAPKVSAVHRSHSPRPSRSSVGAGRSRCLGYGRDNLIRDRDSEDEFMQDEYGLIMLGIRDSMSLLQKCST